MIIKNVTGKDASVLYALAQSAIYTALKEDGKTLEDIVQHTKQHIDENIDAPSCVFLKCLSSTEKEEIVGFILIQDHWNLSDLFVAPAHQAKGVGKALWHKALTMCLAQSPAKNICVNASRNAETFYRGLGFNDRLCKKPSPDFIVPLEYPITHDQ